MRGFGLTPALVAQAICIVAAVAILTLLPPVRGAMLLIPLNAGTGATIELARVSGARLLGRGPVSGSVIVEGDRSAIALRMMGHGTLVMAGRPNLCGEAGSATGRAT